jgi:hypothetical protein
MENDALSDIKAKPEFAALDEAEVLAALDTLDPCNPILIEFSRLLGEYGERLIAESESFCPLSRCHSAAIVER